MAQNVGLLTEKIYISNKLGSWNKELLNKMKQPLQYNSRSIILHLHSKN